MASEVTITIASDNDDPSQSLVPNNNNDNNEQEEKKIINNTSGEDDSTLLPTPIAFSALRKSLSFVIEKNPKSDDSETKNSENNSGNRSPLVRRATIINPAAKEIDVTGTKNLATNNTTTATTNSSFTIASKQGINSQVPPSPALAPTKQNTISSEAPSPGQDRRKMLLQRQQSFDVVAHQQAMAKKREEEIELIIQETFNDNNSIYRKYAASHTTQTLTTKKESTSSPSSSSSPSKKKPIIMNRTAASNQYFYSIPSKDLQRKVAECIWRTRKANRTESDRIKNLVRQEKERITRNEAIAASASYESRQRIREKNERFVEALVQEMDAVIQGQPTALRAIKLEIILQDMRVVRDKDLLMSNRTISELPSSAKKQSNSAISSRNVIKSTKKASSKLPPISTQSNSFFNRKDQTRLMKLLPLYEN